MILNNDTHYKFQDISSEEYREYKFRKNKIARINMPLKLSVSETGAHRVFDADGVSHYIPKGWIQIRWKAKEDSMTDL